MKHYSNIIMYVRLKITNDTFNISLSFMKAERDINIIIRYDLYQTDKILYVDTVYI